MMKESGLRPVRCFLLVLGALILLVGLTGCGLVRGAVEQAVQEQIEQQKTEQEPDVQEPAEPEADAAAPAEEAPAAPAAEAAEPQAVLASEVEEQTVLDQDGVRITVKELDMSDPIWGPELKLLIENDSAENITVQARNVSINGIVADCILSSDVAAGKKANDGISFMTDGLAIAGIEVIQSIELSFHIVNADSWDTILDSEQIVITTNADPDYVQPVNDSGYVALEQDGIKVVIQQLVTDNSLWGADLRVYVENHSQRNVTIQVRDVSVNGFMLDPIFSCDVPAGKSAYDSISFMQDELDENDITAITSVELVLHVVDLDSWDTILDSDMIQIPF